MADDPERIKQRWRMLELLIPAVPIESTVDLVQICRAADALIDFALTGQHPVLPATRDREQGNGGQSPEDRHKQRD